MQTGKKGGVFPQCREEEEAGKSERPEQAALISKGRIQRPAGHLSRKSVAEVLVKKLDDASF